MRQLEYLLSAALLRVCFAVFSLAPVRADKVVFASARAEKLEGNLKPIYDTMVAMRPGWHIVLLLERYSYDFLGKVRYLLHLVRASYHLATARLFIIDNAYLPVHVVRHRRGTHVIQVWHAAGALKRFGVDVSPPDRAVENRFVHKNYDYVIVGSNAAVAPYASALRTPVERVIPLGVAHTDFFFDEAAMAAARERIYARYPQLRGRRVVLHAPTFRGYGQSKHSAVALDALRLREQLPPEFALVNKVHPVLREDTSLHPGFDVTADSEFDINEWFAVTDVFVTDYSSSVFEYALTSKPLILLVGDIEEYLVDPGVYIDYRSEMIGEFARTTDEVAALLLRGEYDMSRWAAFLAKHCEGADGGASRRFVEFVAQLDPPTGVER